MNTEIEKYNFLGVSVSSFSKNQLIEHIKFTVNSNQTNILYGYSLGIFFWIKQCPELFLYAEKSDLFVTDGRLFFLLAKHHGLPIKFDISIPNLVLLTLDLANTYGWNIFVLGATENVNFKAQKRILEKYPNIRSINGRNGFFSHKERDKIIDEINTYNCNILLIGLPSPEKEKIAFECKKKNCSNIIIPCGGMIDLLAGKTKLTPSIFKKCGFASLYRFIQEPKRLFKRMFSFYWYFFSQFLPIYFYRVLVQKDKNFSLTNKN
jgi:N-acetylglucosaminyldiphosphoundecaprenol N-acetyl-beta-D-mannosaminyltransferase